MDLSHHLYLSLADFIRSSLREVLMGEQMVQGTLLPGVQGGEALKVDKVIL